MGKSIVVIQGHPDPDPGHLCRALAAAYAEGAEAAGHTVTVVDVATLDFPILRTSAEFDAGATPEALVPAQQAMLAADHLVVAFPLWLGTLPALTKGFFEQALHRNVAFEPGESNRWPKGRFKGTSARVVATMAMPVPVFRLWFRSHGVKLLEWNILGIAGMHPIRETLFGSVHAVDDAKRKAWIEKMRALGAKGE